MTTETDAGSKGLRLTYQPERRSITAERADNVMCACWCPRGTLQFGAWVITTQLDLTERGRV